jgi:hypothetical protein
MGALVAALVCSTVAAATAAAGVAGGAAAAGVAGGAAAAGATPPRRSHLEPTFTAPHAVGVTTGAAGASSPFPIYGFSVRDYGAAGDGATDDTAAFNAAVGAAVAAGGGTVFVPTGAYLLPSTVWFNSSVPLQVRGEGWSSNLLWAGPGDLLVWAPADGSTPAHLVVSDVAVSCVGAPKLGADGAPTGAAFRFTTGVVRSVLSTLLFYGRGAVPGTGQATTLCGTNLDLGPLTDTVTVRDALHWFVGGTGVIIGRGSEVRILGGRIIGPALRNDSSIGVHVTGNNGGVHVAEADVIGLGVGLRLDDASGAGSNRETFVTHATFDSDGIGVLVNDSSYVSIAGCWAASSDKHQVLLDAGAGGAHVQIVGGTVFNGGVLSGDCSEAGQECNGLTARAGSFSLTGVLVWANKRVGVWVPPGGASGYALTGNRFLCNGQGVRLNGTAYAATGNVVLGSATPDAWGPGAAAGAVVANNVEAAWDC